MPPKSTENASPWTVGGFFLLALVVRLAAIYAWHSRFGDRFVFGDTESYWHLARCLGRGEAYRYGELGAIFRAPGYPLVLAPLFLIFDSPPVWAARMEGAVLGALAVVLIFLWAKRLFGLRTGILAGALSALHLELIFASVAVLSEAAFLPAWALALWLLTLYCTQAERKDANPIMLSIGMGVVFGLASLIRPSAFLWLPFLILVQLLLRRKPIGGYQNWIFAVAGFVVVMAPWWIRNLTISGHVVLTTTQVGASLYDGWNPNANGASNMEFVVAKVEEVRKKNPHLDAVQLEIAVDRHLRQEAFNWAVHNPGSVLWLAAVKLKRFYNIVPNDPGFNVFPINAAIACWSVVIYVSAGLKLLGRHKTPAVLLGCVLPCVYFTVLHMVFVSSIRYRLPVLPGLIVLASAAIVERVGSRKMRCLRILSSVVSAPKRRFGT